MTSRSASEIMFGGDATRLIFYPTDPGATAISETVPMARIQSFLRKKIASGEISRADPELIVACKLAAERWGSEGAASGAAVLRAFAEKRKLSP